MEIENEAIQGDVSTEGLTPVEVVEEIETGSSLSPREEKMAAIVAKREEAIENNNGESKTYEQALGINPDADELAEAELEANINKPSLDNEELELPFYRKDDGTLAMKLKVNGEETERSLDQIVATAQKHESADRKLQDIHNRTLQLDEKERRQEEYEQALLAERQRLESAQQISQPSEQDAGNTDLDELLSSAAEGLFDGDVEKFVQALRPALEGRQQQEPTLNVDQIVEQARTAAIRDVEQRERNQKQHNSEVAFQNSTREGVEWLETEHPEVGDSLKLRNLVDQETIRLMEEKPNLSPKEIIQEATEVVIKKAGIGNDPTLPPSSRESNKTQIKPPPLRQGSSTYVPPVKQEIDTSPQAVIARERARRQKVAGQ